MIFFPSPSGTCFFFCSSHGLPILMSLIFYNPLVNWGCLRVYSCEGIYWIKLPVATYWRKMAPLYCCAREMLVIPQNTHRSQSDATHSRVFILFELALLHPHPPMHHHHTGWFWWWGSPECLSGQGFIVSSKQEGKCASIQLESCCGL